MERGAILLLVLAAATGCTREKAPDGIDGHTRVAVTRAPTPQEIADACYSVDRRVYQDDPENGSYVEPTYDTYRVRAPHCARQARDPAAVTCRFEAAPIPSLSFRSEAEEADYVRHLRDRDYKGMQADFVSVRSYDGTPAGTIEWVAPQPCALLPKPQPPEG